MTDSAVDKGEEFASAFSIPLPRNWAVVLEELFIPKMDSQSREDDLINESAACWRGDNDIEEDGEDIIIIGTFVSVLTSEEITVHGPQEDDEEEEADEEEEEEEEEE